jgi:hypothetical protein
MRADAFDSLLMDGAVAMGYGGFRHGRPASLLGDSAASGSAGARLDLAAASNGATAVDAAAAPPERPRRQSIFKAAPAPPPTSQQASVRVPVECGTLTGVLLLPHPRVVVGEGTAAGKTVSPTEFERMGGKAASKKWRTSIRLLNSESAGSAWTGAGCVGLARACCGRSGRDAHSTNRLTHHPVRRSPLTPPPPQATATLESG